MKDTIYRDDAIKCCRNEWEEEVEERLRHLPSVQSERWIPVSERLPSNEQNLKGFLTTIKCYVENDVFIQVYENGKFGHWDGEKLIPNDDVIAWMEIPEPYMEEEQ